MRTRWFMLGAVLAAAVAVAAVACGDDDEGGGGATATPAAAEATATPAGGEGATVDVQLTEYVISPDPESVAAGSVTFNASNIGSEEHELVIIRTDLAADALPTAEDGSADEAGAGTEVLDEIEEFAAQTEASLTIDLSAGNYVLICNVVDAEGHAHYHEGMTVAFTVTE